ncbi:MAG: hypothetical protein IJH99_08750 [Eubacterium sp.]|nr:hypothetical protein [Eubacterium sp.]
MENPRTKKRNVIRRVSAVVCIGVLLVLFIFKNNILLSWGLSTGWGIKAMNPLSFRIEYDIDTFGFGGEGERFTVLHTGRAELIGENTIKADASYYAAKEMTVEWGTAVSQKEAEGINRIIGDLDPWRKWLTEGFEPAWDMVSFVIDDEYLPDLQDIDAWLNINESDGSYFYILQDREAQRLYLLERIW